MMRHGIHCDCLMCKMGKSLGLVPTCNDQTLFARTDGIEASWQVVTKILEGWSEHEPPLSLYKPGSMGPKEAITLIERDGRHWFLYSD